MLRCGVIGLGRLGYRHAANLAGRIANATLVAVSDSSQQALDRFVQAHPSVRTYLSYEALIADESVDAIIIASSTSMHATMARKAILAHKAIFCEKPLSMEIEEAEAILALLKEHPVFFQLGFMRRFDSSYAKAKQRIDSKALGKAISLRGVSRDPGCPPIAFAKTSGGLIMDLCVHDLDLARWFAGCEATEVYARGSAIRYPELAEIGDVDHVDITLTFENGFLACLEGSRNSQYGYDVRTEVVCTEGAVFIGGLEHHAMQEYTKEGIVQDTIDGFLTRFDEAYLNELAHFVQDVLSGSQPKVGVFDGLQAQRLALGANASLASGKPVRLEYEKRGM